jgi:hypothetical protein
MNGHENLLNTAPSAYLFNKLGSSGAGPLKNRLLIRMDNIPGRRLQYAA